MSRLLAASIFAVLLMVGAAPSGEAQSTESTARTAADSPAFCSNYATGSDTHTACAPSASAPQGSTVACHNYTIGSDSHAECAPVPASRLNVPREKKGGLVPPPSTMRCYTYHIGSSAYTDCR